MSNSQSLLREIQWTSSAIGIYIMLSFMLQARESVNEAVIVTIFVLGCCVLLNLRKPETGYPLYTILAVVLSGVFTLQLSITEVWQAPCILWIGAFKKILLGIGIYANIFFAMRSILIALLRENSQTLQQVEKISSSKKHRNRLRLCKCMVAAESILFIVSTYPGIWLQSDVFDVYNAAVTSTWDAWHTIGYVWFVKLCTLIFQSQFTVNIVQTALWILLNFYIIHMLAERSPTFGYVYTFLICSIITPFLYLEVMEKDTVYSMGMLALTVVLYKVLSSKKMDWKDIFCLTTLPLFAILCRQGGIVPVLISCLAVVIYLFVTGRKPQTKKMLAATIWLFCAWLLVNVVLVKALSVKESPPFIKYSVPISMVGAAVSQGVQFSETDVEILERITTMEEWGSCYNRYWADDLARAHGKIGPEAIERLEDQIVNNGFGPELIRINAELLISHPVIYLRAFFDMNSILWEFAKPMDAPVMALCQVPEDSQVRYTAAYTITGPLTQFMDNYPITRAVMTRGGVSLFMLLFCAVVLGLRNKVLLLAFMPIGLMESMLFLSVPAQDPRYVLPAIECAVFFLSIVVSQWLCVRKKEPENG